MSEPRIELPNGREITLAQALELVRLAEEHPGSTWHLAECECCVCFHPYGEVRRGWVIGPDGESEYREGKR